MPVSLETPVLVALVEITEPTSGLIYLPYAAALLQSYALAQASEPERYRFLRPLFLRQPIQEMAAELSQADIVGFSVYVWNVNYNLAIAKALKALKPDVLIVFGGPQVPDQAESFLRSFPFIDVACHGEGEATFLRLLEAFPDKDWQEIPGISYLDQEQSFVARPRAPRLKDLEAIPSPFLSGIFEPLLASHPEFAWASVWETNRGCPFSCTFCDWGSNIASKIHRFGQERLYQEMRWLGQHQIEFIFCTDANYGILPRDLELARELVRVNQELGYPQRVVTQMTKNQPERAFEAHKILRDAGMLVAATLSLQSTTPAVLSAIKRDNISLKVYQQLLQRFIAADIPTYTDILLGLPGETFDSFVEVLDTVISQGQHTELRIWNTHLLPNAEIASAESRQRYGIEAVIMPCHAPSDPASREFTGIQEECEMIIATHSMSRQDWIRAEALSWMVQMLYYCRLLQLPLLLTHALTGLSHREMIMAFFEGPLPQGTPLQDFIRQYFLSKAQSVSQGQNAYSATRDPQSGQTIWVSPQTYIVAQLMINQQLGPYYRECKLILEALLKAHRLSLPPRLLDEALELVQRVLEGSLEQGYKPAYNLQEAYQRILKGQTFQLTYFGRPLNPAGPLSLADQTR